MDRRLTGLPGQAVCGLSGPARFKPHLMRGTDVRSRNRQGKTTQLWWHPIVRTHSMHSARLRTILSTLRVREQEAGAQRAAVEQAQRSLELAMNRYKGGLVTYLEVVSAQTIALQNERTAVDLLRRRMLSSVLLIKALGGGWNISKLPQA